MFSAADGQILHSFQGLTQETGISCFHPSVPVLAAASGKLGRIHLLRPSSS